MHCIVKNAGEATLMVGVALETSDAGIRRPVIRSIQRPMQPLGWYGKTKKMIVTADVTVNVGCRYMWADATGAAFSYMLVATPIAQPLVCEMGSDSSV